MSTTENSKRRFGFPGSSTENYQLINNLLFNATLLMLNQIQCIPVGEGEMERVLTGLCKSLHIVSSAWVLVLAGVIFVDVMGRALFNHPLLGTAEIVKNSIVAITFLQIPLAFLVGAMLRTTIILDAAGPGLKRLIELAATLLAIFFFIALAAGSYEPFLQAWRIGEYEGEGAMRVPTYPVRGVVLVMAVLSTIVLLWQLFRIISKKRHTI